MVTNALLDISVIKSSHYCLTGTSMSQAARRFAFDNIQFLALQKYRQAVGTYLTVLKLSKLQFCLQCLLDFVCFNDNPFFIHGSLKASKLCRFKFLCPCLTGHYSEERSVILKTLFKYAQACFQLFNSMSNVASLKLNIICIHV